MRLAADTHDRSASGDVAALGLSAMKTHRVSGVVAAALIVCYGVFLAWYGGSGRPLTDAEVETYMAALAGRVGHAGFDSATLERMRAFAEADDGRAFHMVNLIRFRDRTAYPPGEDPGGTVADADARYARAVVPLLLARAAHPVVLLRPGGALFDAAPDTRWDSVVTVRHRSRRDFLDMITSPAYARAEVHKWASVAATTLLVADGTLVPDARILVLLVFVVVGASVMATERLVRRRPREGYRDV